MNKKKWFAIIVVAVAGFAAYNWTTVRAVVSGLSCETLGPLIIEEDFNQDRVVDDRLIHIANIKTISTDKTTITCHGVGVFGDTIEAKIEFGTEEKFEEVFLYFRTL